MAIAEPTALHAHICGPCKRGRHATCVRGRCTCDVSSACPGWIEPEDDDKPFPGDLGGPPLDDDARAPGPGDPGSGPEPGGGEDELPAGFTWEEPPRPGPKPEELLDIASLMPHPGRWARVRVYDKPTTATSTAMKARKGEVKLPPGRWEFQATKNRPSVGHSALYARYVGPDEDAT